MHITHTPRCAALSLTFDRERLVIGILLALAHSSRYRGEACDLHASVAAHMLLGYLQIHLANAEEALLLLCSSHCRRCRCHAAAAARMRERTLVAGCQLIHWPGIRWDAQFLVHVRRLWPEAAAVQGAAYDAQGVLVNVTPILAVGIPVGKHTKKEDKI